MRIALHPDRRRRGCRLPRLAAAVAAALAVDWPPPSGSRRTKPAISFSTHRTPRRSPTTARAVVGDAAVDILVQPAAERRKRLLVADLESTIIENEMLDELALILGIGPQRRRRSPAGR